MATHKSEELYRKLVEETSDLITRVDGNGRFTYVNQAAETIFGAKPEACVGLSAFEFVHPEDRKRTREWFDDCVRRQVAAATIENRLVSRTGTISYMLWTSNFHFGSSGAVTGINSIARDITERRRVEEALQESEKRFTQIAENAQEWIWEVDADGLYTYASPAVETVLGYKPEEIVGKKHFYDLLHPEDRDATKVAAFAVFAGKQPFRNFANRNIHRNGRSVWLSTSGVPKLDERGQLLGYRGVDADITERKEAEQKVLESERKFRALFESTNDAVMLLDANEFFECNEATLKVFGCSSREQCIGKHPSQLSPATQPDGTDSQTAAKKKIELAIETGRANFEWLHCRADGTAFMADVLLSSMELNGRTVLQAVVRDISDRKEAEKAVLRERAMLRRLLESSDRDRNLMAYEIHDGFAQYVAGARMQFEAASQFKDANDEAATLARECGLTLLSRSLDEARRLISGLRPPILDELGVVDAIQHFVQDPSMREGPEICFASDIVCNRLEPLLENAIFRIVQEGVTNARKYSKSEKIEIGLTQQDNRICIEVQDWGIGFDPDDTADTSFGIRGIQERSRHLGGYATIDSTPGQGTRIRVELPLAGLGSVNS